LPPRWPGLAFVHAARTDHSGPACPCGSARPARYTCPRKTRGHRGRAAHLLSHRLHRPVDHRCSADLRPALIIDKQHRYIRRDDWLNRRFSIRKTMPSKQSHRVRRGRVHSRRLSHLAVTLDCLMASHGRSARSLTAAIDPTSDCASRRSLLAWRNAQWLPQMRQSLQLLQKIEEHFGLAEGYLTKLALPQSPTADALRLLNSGRQTVLRQHLPSDFDIRPLVERTEILAWVSANILPCNTDYGKYQSRASQNHYTVVFPTLPRLVGGRPWLGELRRGKYAIGKIEGYGTVPAPQKIDDRGCQYHRI
jgi:hypothetical protein